MSTEHQKYSIENQSIAIAAYALEHRCEVVKSYEDPATSGLTIEARIGLKSLLADVVRGDPGFDLVLVYDVSRWGRFQDPDEAAHYEYICREAGVQVEYCAEPFDNDESLSSVLMKHLKRAMAAEYSRELSVKVSAAQRNLASLGYKQGGPAGYGYHRQVVDDTGQPRELLKKGDRKSLHGQRIVLVLGDEAEVATVKRIFRLFVYSGFSRRSIAEILNAEDVPSPSHARWTEWGVGRILRQERYAGTFLFGRRRNRLGAQPTWNPPQDVVRIVGAVPGIVDPKLFQLAQANLRRHLPKLSSEELLSRLRALYQARGKLSQGLIRAAPGLPSHATYISRFGSLENAYRLVGYTPQPRRAPPRRISTACAASP